MHSCVEGGDDWLSAPFAIMQHVRIDIVYLLRHAITPTRGSDGGDVVLNAPRMNRAGGLIVERIMLEVIGEEGELTITCLVDGVATFARGGLGEHRVIRGEGEEAGGGK